MPEVVPEYILDVGALERRAIANAAVAKLDEGRQLAVMQPSMTALRSVLENPFLLDGQHDVESTASTAFVWRLGVACDMSRLVLASVANVTVSAAERSQWITHDQGVSVARALVAAEPDVLQKLDAQQLGAFWSLAGYRPTGELNTADDGIENAMRATRAATYVPRDLLDSVRGRRAEIATMEHLPEVEAITSSPEGLRVEWGEVDEAGAKLVESLLTVLYSGFLARHSGDPVESRVLEHSIDEYSQLTAALADGGSAAGIVLAMRLHEIGCEAFTGPLIAQIDERIARCDPLSLELDELVYLVKTIIEFTKDVPSVAMATFVERSVVRIREAGQFFVQTVDPDTIVADLNHETMKKAAQADILPRELRRLEAMLTPSAPRTAEDTLADLSAHGFSEALLSEAFDFIAGELDMQRRAQLMEQPATPGPS